MASTLSAHHRLGRAQTLRTFEYLSRMEVAVVRIHCTSSSRLDSLCKWGWRSSPRLPTFVSPLFSLFPLISSPVTSVLLISLRSQPVDVASVGPRVHMQELRGLIPRLRRTRGPRHSISIRHCPGEGEVDGVALGVGRVACCFFRVVDREIMGFDQVFPESVVFATALPFTWSCAGSATVHP